MAKPDAYVGEEPYFNAYGVLKGAHLLVAGEQTGLLANLRLRVQASVRGHSLINADDNSFSLAKMTPIKERFNLEFRAEVFYVFNRGEFSLPSESITKTANPTTGYITSQINQPILIQVALRLTF